jgi:hypothetical protein
MVAAVSWCRHRDRVCVHVYVYNTYTIVYVYESELEGGSTQCVYIKGVRVHMVYVRAEATGCPGKNDERVVVKKNIRPLANANVKFSRGFLIVIGRFPFSLLPPTPHVFLSVFLTMSLSISSSLKPRLRSRMAYDTCIYNIVAGYLGFFSLYLPALTLISSCSQSL